MIAKNIRGALYLNLELDVRGMCLIGGRMDLIGGVDLVGGANESERKDNGSGWKKKDLGSKFRARIGHICTVFLRTRL